MTSGMPDMAALLAQAQQMQQEILAAQEQLARAQVSGTAGGGLVVATVSGGGELLSLVIAPAAMVDTDAETLADLVVAAVRDANRAAADLQQDTMGPLAAGIGGMGGMGGIADDLGLGGMFGGGNAGLPPGSPGN